MAYQWYVEADGEKRGPYGSAELKRMADTGLIWPTIRLWRDGLVHPVEAGHIEGLFAAAPQISPAAMPPHLPSREITHEAPATSNPQPPPPVSAEGATAFLELPAKSADYVRDPYAPPQPIRSGESDYSEPMLPGGSVWFSQASGGVFMLVGLGMMVYGMFSDKTVGGLGERTYNIGLLNESTNFVIFGGAIFLAGVIESGVVRLLRLLSRINEN